MKKIDLHIHMLPQALYRDGREFLADPRSQLPNMDRLGIEKAVLMSAGEGQEALGNNESSLEICRSYPERFAFMCNLDPHAPQSIYQRLVFWKEQGAIGIGELMYNRPFDDPFYQELFAAAQELELPVTFHMSPEQGMGYGIVDHPGMPLLEQALQRYPKLKFLGHSKAFWIEISGDAPTDSRERNGSGKSPVTPGGRIPELMDRYPNLYGDLSAMSGANAILRDEAFGLGFLERYQDRLFFATDMLNSETVAPLGAWLDEKAGTGRLSSTAYEKIIRGNAERVFAL